MKLLKEILKRIFGVTNYTYKPRQQTYTVFFGEFSKDSGCIHIMNSTTPYADKVLVKQLIREHVGEEMWKNYPVNFVNATGQVVNLGEFKLFLDEKLCTKIYENGIRFSYVYRSTGE